MDSSVPRRGEERHPNQAMSSMKREVGEAVGIVWVAIRSILPEPTRARPRTGTAGERTSAARPRNAASPEPGGTAQPAAGASEPAG